MIDETTACIEGFVKSLKLYVFRFDVNHDLVMLVISPYKDLISFPNNKCRIYFGEHSLKIVYDSMMVIDYVDPSMIDIIEKTLLKLRDDCFAIRLFGA